MDNGSYSSGHEEWQKKKLPRMSDSELIKYVESSPYWTSGDPYFVMKEVLKRLKNHRFRSM